MLNKKLIIIISAILIIMIGLIGYNVLQNNYKAGKVEITINTVPKDAKVTIGEQTFGNGINYIKSGEYSIKIEKDGFKTVELNQYIYKNGYELNISLVAESDQAKQWAEKNKDSYSKMSGIIAQEASKNGEYFKRINPITTKIPYTNYLFSIGYKLDKTDKKGEKIIITINSSEQYRQSALLKLRSFDNNLADYDYEFINHKNPFKIWKRK